MSNSTEMSSNYVQSPPTRLKPRDQTCVICDDASSNYHFGQPTCSACAAFFRRTIRNKRKYTCKFNGDCDIHKTNRNICRSCRFKKCLERKMDQSEVRQLEEEGSQTHSMARSHQYSPTGSTSLVSSPFSPSSALSPTNSQINHQPSIELKYLHRMQEGYHQYGSLRKASYSMMVLDGEIYDELKPPKGHYDNYSKMCKVAASISFDIASRFFLPFGDLEFNEKFKLFGQFFHPFCNTNRCYKSYKVFGINDDRFFMPDGGILQLSQLHLYFADSKFVTAEPEEVAKVFHNAINYLINQVVGHMRQIEMQEMELMAIYGMFLWRENPELSAKTNQMVRQVRDGIILDLHYYYKNMVGYGQEEITLKTANLFLLIPKMENAIKMMVENTTISELFNMITVEESCVGHVIV